MTSLRPMFILALIASILGVTTASQAGPDLLSPPAEATSQQTAIESLRKSVSDNIGIVRRDDRSLLITGRLGAYGTLAEDAARTFLERHPKLFDTSSDTPSLRLIRQREDAGLKHLVFQQYYQDVKVYDAEIVFNFDRDGVISFVGGRYEPDAQVSTTPELSPSAALSVLQKWIIQLGQSPRFHADYLSEGVAPLENELVVYDDPSGNWHLAYYIIQPSLTKGQSHAETYEAFVDAHTGELISTPRDVNQYRDVPMAAAKNETIEAMPGGNDIMLVTPKGWVYKKGNPIAGTGDTNLTDQSFIPDSAYKKVVLPRISSPIGLIGKYVNCSKLTSLSYRAGPDHDGNYLYKRNTDPLVGSKFDAVMAYYFVDFAQNYISETLGITNAAHRSINVNINGRADDQSSYTPNSRGTGYIVMGSGGVDDAEDAEVILHEYGHALLDSLRYGIWSGAGTAGMFAGTAAMSEGFGDYFAASITSQFFLQKNTTFEMQFAEWNYTAKPSLRRVLNSTKKYPQDVVGEEHDDGEIWSSVLWQIRKSVGAPKADKLFLLAPDGVIKIASHFPDGAVFIVQRAAELGYDKSAQDNIRKRFQDRGILPKITVTAPARTTSWKAGTTHNVSWSYKGGDKDGQSHDSVKIELLSNGAVVSTLASSVSAGLNGKGSYSWTIPGNTATGSKYQLRITSVNYKPVVTADSDSFAITEQQADHWIGNWIQVNYLTTDDNGVWDPDDLSGIGFVANITATKWTEIDEYGNGCAVTFSYTVDSNNRVSKDAIYLGDKCPPMPLPLLDETGRLEFWNDNQVMFEYFDLAPGDDIVAFKWIRQ